MSRAPRPQGTRPVRAPRLEEPAPEPGALTDGHAKLEAVLARVARARDDRLLPIHDAVDEVVVAEGLDVGIRQAQRRVAAIGPWSARSAASSLLSRRAHPLGRLTDEPLPVLPAVAGVHDELEVLHRPARDDDVVHRTTRLPRKGRVLRLPVHELRHVVGGDALEEGEAARSLDLEERPCARRRRAPPPAHGPVLGDEARVLDRHVPPAERDHLAPAAR